MPPPHRLERERYLPGQAAADAEHLIITKLYQVTHAKFFTEPGGLPRTQKSPRRFNLRGPGEGAARVARERA